VVQLVESVSADRGRNGEFDRHAEARTVVVRTSVRATSAREERQRVLTAETARAQLERSAGALASASPAARAALVPLARRSRADLNFNLRAMTAP
jgi:hypothetical protein